jgi:hypothetical protein
MFCNKNKIKISSKVKIKYKNVLPSNLIIDSAGSHLYRSGLSLFKFGDKPRYKLCNPLLIFIVLLYIIIKCFIFLLFKSNDHNFNIMIGNYPYFLGIENHINLLIIIGFIMPLIFQLINFYNYYNNIKPIYLKPFEMLSGLISPQSIGLNSTENIIKLIKLTKRLLIVEKFNKITIPIPSFYTCFIPISINSTFGQIILYAIPWSCYYGLIGYYYYNIMVYQAIYFYIICVYLKIKIKSYNNYMLTLVNNKKENNSSKITSLIESLYSIYSEINSYNNNYWAKFWFWFYFLNIVLICILLFPIIYVKLNFILNLLFIYTIITLIFIILFFINTASMICYEVNKSYKYLNSTSIKSNFKISPINSLKV